MTAAVPNPNPSLPNPIGTRAVVGLALGAIACFHGAFLLPVGGGLLLGFFACLFPLRRVPTGRRAFYGHLVIGLACYTPHLGFLWNVFGPAAIPLWFILPFWLAVFGLLIWHVNARHGWRWCACLAPVIWTGLEYFRCEIWWLRFSWLAAGSANGTEAGSFLSILGVFGLGFALCAVSALGTLWVRSKPTLIEVAVAVVMAGIVLGIFLPAGSTAATSKERIPVAALQLEFPAIPDVLAGLERVRTNHARANLIVLSEYTFDGPPPKSVRDWCRTHGKWLIAGGKEFLSDASQETTGPAHNLHGGATGSSAFRNTAFVVSPKGEIVFTQAKAQPIQFFNDGLPAAAQRLWDSPWGRIGMGICYDASFRRVTDELVRQGAQALIFPTMDVEEWGAYEHRLNARQSKLRAVEYRLPVLRVASSGPSLLINRSGWVIASTEVPGQGEILSGELSLMPRGRLPLDRWLAPACLAGTGGLIAWLVLTRRRGHRAAVAMPTPLA
jgi:apolipoprotein N-acyltransferase